MKRLQTGAGPVTRTEMREAYLLCRSVLRHAWVEVPATDADMPKDGWPFVSQCTRCTTRKVAVFNRRNGGIVRVDYVWPKDYKLAETASPSELRMEFARRRDFDFIGAAKRKKNMKKAS